MIKVGSEGGGAKGKGVVGEQFMIPKQQHTGRFLDVAVAMPFGVRPACVSNTPSYTLSAIMQGEGLDRVYDGETE